MIGYRTIAVMRDQHCRAHGSHVSAYWRSMDVPARGEQELIVADDRKEIRQVAAAIDGPPVRDRCLGFCDSPLRRGETLGGAQHSSSVTAEATPGSGV